MPEPEARAKTALVLTGGGARAAYQAGVLLGIRETLPEPRRNPFPILCGTSAGAVNAAVLATFAENFGLGVRFLSEVWRRFRAADIYRADAAGIAASGARWLSALTLGWLIRQNPRCLLDNAPLRRLLERTLDLRRIDRAIENGALYAVCVNASGYFSGESVSFFQAAPQVQPWRRTQRSSVRVQLNVDHLLASSAIPFVFPAVKIHREYFGDGSMRLVAPVSPAVHLGADRVLVVGAGRGIQTARNPGEAYPSLAQIAGHALSSIFLDTLELDLERLQRINRVLDLIPAGTLAREPLDLRRIDALVIAPSRRLEEIASEHIDALPRPVRAMLGGVGATRRSGSHLASYLLFEAPYTQALMDLGYQDTMARRAEVAAFLAGGCGGVPTRAIEGPEIS
jgi:NTE family protein